MHRRASGRVCVRLVQPVPMMLAAQPTPAGRAVVLRIERKSLAVDQPAVLCDRHVNAGAALGIDQWFQGNGGNSRFFDCGGQIEC